MTRLEQIQVFQREKMQERVIYKVPSGEIETSKVLQVEEFLRRGRAVAINSVVRFRYVVVED